MSVRWRIRGIAQRNQLARRIFRRREWCVWVGVDDREDFPTAFPANSQALTLNRHNPVFFVKDLPLRRLHIPMLDATSTDREVQID